MKSFKKTMRLFGIALLIVLATFGVGIGGGVPSSPNKKGENLNEIKTEVVEIKDDKTQITELKDIKQ